MRKLGHIVFGVLSLAAASGVSFADNLVQVYQQALVNDPTFKKAQADWLVAKQTLPLAMVGTGAAGSGLFPNLSVAGNYFQTYSRVRGVTGTNSGNFNTRNYAVNLTQPIFNLATWMSISSARYTVRAAVATYLASAQDLMSRTANAYFEVLRANAKLTLTLAQKKQFLHQLVTAEQKFRVGLIAITGVYDAQASYDGSIATEIKDRNELQDRLEDLRAITGKKYRALVDLNSTIPLVIPQPQSITRWVAVALKQNYVIQADLNNMFAARENIKGAVAAKVPTLNLTGSYTSQRAGSLAAPPLTGTAPAATTGVGTVGLALNFPVLRGGFDIVNIKQNRYKYLSTSDQLVVDHRTVENNTRQAYLGIESGISQIKADEQAIISSRNQLEATKAGYIVGTRTMVDVLDSVTTLTRSQLNYADDRYNYVEGIVNLKQQAGTLSPAEIQKLNRWLRPNIKFSLKQPVVKMRSTPKHYPQVSTDLLKINTPSQTSPLDTKTTPPTTPGGSVPPAPLNTPKSQAVPSPALGTTTPKASTGSSASPLDELALPDPKAASNTPKAQPDQSVSPGAHQTIQKPYAIEVFASKHKVYAESFIMKHKNLLALEMVHNASGNGWYRVIAGRYATAKQSADALKQLPKSITQYHPWVVKLS